MLKSLLKYPELVETDPGFESWQSEKAMTPHSSTLAWKIPWTEEPGGLPSVGSQSQTGLKQLSTHARTHHLRYEQASQVAQW